MFKRKQCFCTFMIGVFLLGTALLSGCGKNWEPVDALWEGLTQGAKTSAVVLQTEAEKIRIGDSELTTSAAEEELEKKPLPVIISTWADAEKVSAAYQYNGGDVISPSTVAELGKENFFVQMMIDDALFARIYGKSYKEDCTLPLSHLRYLRLLHRDFEGQIRIGEIICNKSISDDLLEIFHKLYTAEYPIEKVLLADEYENADIMLSSADNNTAAFNYRNTVGKTTKSLHAQGIAIDINPLYNPYIMYQSDGSYEVAPANGEPYMDRRKDFPYKIDRDDLCYKLFTEAGFTWGGIWNSPDYMHFFRK